MSNNYDDIETAVERYWSNQECFISDFFTAMAKVYSEVGDSVDDSIRQLEYAMSVISHEVEILSKKSE